MSWVFASYRSGLSLQTNSNEDTDCSVSLHANLRIYTISIVPTAFTLSSRAFIYLPILLWKQSMLDCFHVILSGQLRQLLAILEMKFARIMTHMQILLNKGFYVPSWIPFWRCFLILILARMALSLVVWKILDKATLSYVHVRILPNQLQMPRQMWY